MLAQNRRDAEVISVIGKYLLPMVPVLLCLFFAVSAGSNAQAQPTRAASGHIGFVEKLFGPRDATQLLPLDEAFKIAAAASGANRVAIHFNAAKGHYFYRDKFVVDIEKPPTVEVVRIEWPRGEMKSDPFFGNTEVIERPAEAIMHLNRHQTSAVVITLRVKYQGCNYAVGVCFPPVEKHLAVELPASKSEKQQNYGPA